MTLSARAILSRLNPDVTILVVEDEPLIRLNSVDLIEDAGFVVLDASNAEQALGILESGQAVGVVFTDVEMPGTIDGIDLVDIVRQRWPDVGIIVTSGKTSGLNARLPDGVSFFSKPVQGKMLIATIRALLS